MLLKMAFCSSLLKENNPQKKQKYLEKIDASGKLLLDLVNDTLELSRIESGKAVLEPEDAPDLLDEPTPESATPRLDALLGD